MSTDNDKDAIETLRVLNDMGAINLDVLVRNAAEVKSSLADRGVALEPGDICYKFTMHVGPRFFDLVSVAAEIEELGYRFDRVS
jgi:hypothetical protein